MKKLCGALLACVLAGVRDAMAADSMRVDFYHTGSDKEERFSLDRIVVERCCHGPAILPARSTTATGRSIVPGGGRRERPRDLFARLQLYLRRVGNHGRSPDDEPDVLRIAPVSRRDAPANITVRKRNAAMHLSTSGRSVSIQRTSSSSAFSGCRQARLSHCTTPADPTTKLDLLILGDGYTASERRKFERDARRLTDVLFATSPFKERKADINVWGLVPPAAQQSITTRRALPPLASRRYLRCVRLRALHPHRSRTRRSAILPPTRRMTSSKSSPIPKPTAAAGSSGCSALPRPATCGRRILFIHESSAITWLAWPTDHYTSDVAYLPATDRVEAVGAECHRAQLIRPSLKWRDLVVTARHSVADAVAEDRVRGVHPRDSNAAPTAARPSNRPEAEMNVLFREEMVRETWRCGTPGRTPGKVGAFEGANYEAAGLLPSAGGLHHVYP